MAKKFSEFTAKTTIDDTDVFLLSENGAGTKKVTGATMKSELGGGVSQNYSTSEIALKNSDGTPLLWIDGKQVFQKSYTPTTVGVVTFDDIGLDTLIQVFGTELGVSTSAIYPIMNGATNSFFAKSGSRFGFFIDSNGGLPVNITIQYTKI